MESSERANTRLSAFTSGRQWRLFGHGYQTSQTVEQLQTFLLLLMWLSDAARLWFLFLLIITTFLCKTRIHYILVFAVANPSLYAVTS